MSTSDIVDSRDIPFTVFDLQLTSRKASSIVMLQYSRTWPVSRVLVKGARDTIGFEWGET